jgi:phenylpyruvate tautomerase PptA (4-oxalocrotonate tautomerase family)
MPIVTVRIVGDLSKTVRRCLAQRLADAVGEALDSLPGQTWVVVQRASATEYAESGGAPAGLRPIFVTVMKRAMPQARKLRNEIAALTRAVAAATGRPEENIHVIYEPPARGRVAFGGRLLE